MICDSEVETPLSALGVGVRKASLILSCVPALPLPRFSTHACLPLTNMFIVRPSSIAVRVLSTQPTPTPTRNLTQIHLTS
jgi:hypothetical protein